MNDSYNKNDRPGSGGKNKGEAPRDTAGWRGPGKTLLFWAVLILGGLVVFQYLTGMNPEVAEISYSEFTQQIGNSNITEATFLEREIEGKLKDPTTFASSKSNRTFAQFRTRIPFPDTNYDIVKRLEASGAKIKAAEKGPDFLSILVAVGPWILLIFVWIFFLRQMQGASGPKGLFSFGKSKAKLLTDERPKVTFSDVAVADETKEEFQEIIKFLSVQAKVQ